MSPSTDPLSLLRLSGVTKRYGSFTANDGVDLSIAPGEIQAILGENGAGKSTLMKSIFGVHQPDEGAIIWKGQEVRIDNPSHARDLGISMVFQHFSLFETVSVAENVSLTVRMPLDALRQRIRKKGEEFGLPVNPDALVHGLSVGERQRVEIIRCLLQDPELLILDEPTSVLPPPNVTQLFETLRKLSDKGIAILYISHKLDEIRTLCHSATILQNGRVTGTADPKAATSTELAQLMIGREIPHAAHPEADGSGDVRLAAHALSFPNPDPHGVSVRDVDLTVRSGEILGIAGVSGNGQSLLARLLSGEDTLPVAQGDAISLMGQPVGHLGPDPRRDAGLGFVPEDRLGRGAAPPLSLSDNGLLTGHRQGMVRRGLILNKVRDTFADACIKAIDVRAQGRGALASTLSGGNLQKYILARELALEPKAIVISQPTWGIDVGAAAIVRQKLVDLRDTGTAILVISEELEELFEISDRIAVMYDGRLSAPLRARDTNAEVIGQMMIGNFAAGGVAA